MTHRETRRGFVAWNGAVFRRCQRAKADVMTPAERAALRRGFLRYHPRLKDKRNVGDVFYSHTARAKGVFWVQHEGRRLYLPRHCKGPPSPTAAVNSLCRGSVREQTDKVRKPSYEVDHAGPPSCEFAALVARWMAREDVSHGVLLSSQTKRGGVLRLGSPWHESWAAFHAKHAVLRCISPEAHRLKTQARHRALAAAA